VPLPKLIVGAWKCPEDEGRFSGPESGFGGCQTFTFTLRTSFSLLRAYSYNRLGSESKTTIGEAGMTTLLCKGEHVRHNKKAEWGIGKITEVNRCGTIRVLFAGYTEVWIAKGSKYLVKVNTK